MHVGTGYRLSEFLYWTRRSIYGLVIVSAFPVILYQVLGWRWVALPWTIVAMLGTAAAFLVGFKNTQTYNRTWEARQIWGAILNLSRVWGAAARDFPSDAAAGRDLIYRHLAWLTALRYQMRDPRTWETANLPENIEYSRFFDVPEKQTPLAEELAKYLGTEDVARAMRRKNRAAQILADQSAALKEFSDAGRLDNFRFLELQKIIHALFDQQGRSERIKNFPYPRQLATINRMFVRLFCFLLPFGVLREFEKLNDGLEGPLAGCMIWLAVPMSALVSWVFASLEQVGQSTENPFEGTANDVPISQLSRAIEIDLREMLGEKDLPPALTAKNNIVL